MAKTPLKSRINRFFYRNQGKGVRNLMLYIAIGNAVVYLLNALNPDNTLFANILRFDVEGILKGQIWRLFSYPLVYLTESGLFFGAISLLFYYWCGKTLDQYWGPLRFNCFYLCGIVLTDIAGLAAGLVARAEAPDMVSFVSSFVSVTYVNMSLLLAMATVLPEEKVLLYFVIPVKMKWLAWISLGLMLFGLIRLLIILISSATGLASPYLLLLIPLMAVANYLLFFGRQAADILPDFIRFHPKKKSWQRQAKVVGPYADKPRADAAARFRCTVCGRTELSDPGLEFRYCSKCAGYRCYCQDHINNHTHITE